MGKSKDLATGAAYQDQTESDTRYVNTAGDTMTGTLVAGTRLQVGDSSITNAYSGNPAFGYVADFQGSSGTQTFISIAAPTASSLGDNGVIIGEDATDTYFLQRGNKNVKLATQDTVRLTVDGSGRVTMPYQPVFGASGYSGTTTQLGGYNPLLWSNVHTNVGNCFNNSTGKFTFPVSGRYHYFCNVNLKSSDGNWLGLYLIYNGTGQINSWSRNATNFDYNNTIISGVTDATANDYMAFAWHPSYVSPVLNNSSYIHASIHLIG